MSLLHRYTSTRNFHLERLKLRNDPNVVISQCVLYNTILSSEHYIISIKYSLIPLVNYHYNIGCDTNDSYYSTLCFMFDNIDVPKSEILLEYPLLCKDDKFCFDIQFEDELYLNSLGVPISDPSIQEMLLYLCFSMGKIYNIRNESFNEIYNYYKDNIKE